ncbi:MAG TPA: alpha/beta hydrolase [Paracoccaceae bacterium]|nr:alpha/beta hydrolase [Paracoccaceae bacterium]
MSGRFTAPDGIALAWEEEGEGLPLLCLPGLTRNARDFDDLAAALGGRHRLIRLTMRGRKGSDRDPDPRNYIVPVEARDVLAFLDFLGLDRVVVVGTSRGGLIAMVMAAAAPERLAGVLLNDIGPEIASEGLARIMTYLGREPQARSHAEAAAALKANMGAEFPGLSDERWLLCAQRWFDAGPEGLVLNYDPRLREAVEASSAQPAPDMWPLFDALAPVPVAVVRGANSDLLTPETVARMQARRRDLIVAEVPDRGHVPFLDEPESLAALDALVERVRGQMPV